MDEIIQILMRRDNISKNEARNLVERCQAEIDDALCHMNGIYATYDTVTDIIESILGLEPDYLIYFI